MNDNNQKASKVCLAYIRCTFSKFALHTSGWIRKYFSRNHQSEIKMTKKYLYYIPCSCCTENNPNSAIHSK